MIGQQFDGVKYLFKHNELLCAAVEFYLPTLADGRYLRYYIFSSVLIIKQNKKLCTLFVK